VNECKPLEGGLTWDGGFQGATMDNLGPADRGHDGHPATPKGGKCRPAKCDAKSVGAYTRPLVSST
jgi:hypothetical protein